MFLRDFDFDFDAYLFSFLTYLHSRWYHNVIHTSTNLQLSAADLLKCVCPFVTNRHGSVKNCSNMIFSALWTFFSGLKFIWTCIEWLEYCCAPLLVWIIGAASNNSHANWWSSVCLILFLCTIKNIKMHNAH